MNEKLSPNQSHLSFAELMGLILSFHGRLDTLWQRMLYTHAALVGVMVFFASTQNPFVVPRLLVFFFYSLNTAITVVAFSETYSGLKAVVADLHKFDASERTGNLQQWITDRSYTRHAGRRVFALLVVWAVLAYLLVFPLLPF